MTPEQRAAFVKALRTTSKRQGQRALVSYEGISTRAPSRYCCIGAAVFDLYPDFIFSYMMAGYTQTSAASKELGITNVEQSVLVHWNDSERISFESIATRIEDGRLDSEVQYYNDRGYFRWECV
jgi:hypothetical protein